jgi:hypothetical protein
MSDEDRKVLADIYAAAGVPVDQLALEPKELSSVVSAFRRRREKALSGEQLLRELFRLRKQGKLTKARSSPVVKRGSRSA